MLKPTATGTHTRVQMKRPSHDVTIHGSIVTYNPDTGVFTAFLDSQAATEMPMEFTPAPGVPSGYVDATGRPWSLIR